MRQLYFLGLLLGLVSLAGCGGGEHDDIKQWMAEASKDMRGNVPPLPELQILPIVSYDPKGNLDPFSAGRIEPDKVETGGKQPDFNRPREQLESYPLESLNFIGLLDMKKGGKRVALILADQAMFQVGVGNYLGGNFGRIVEISDTEIKLIETVQDPTGQTRDWVERATTLTLQEGGSGKEARK